MSPFLLRISWLPLPALLLLLSGLLSAVSAGEAGAKQLAQLKRQKREWLIPPKKLKENFDYRGQTIAVIRSDEEVRTNIVYSLEGEGASESPFGLFIVDPKNGKVQVTNILDREERANYSLFGVAKFRSGVKAERDIELRVEVLDENDCAPKFTITSAGAVNESSATDTFIMKITATDDDDPKTDNAKIFYSVIQQYPVGEQMFYIHSSTGEIHVRRPTLDRELHASYNLTITGADLAGRPKGHTSTATVSINILDINDNVPTLEREMYEGSVEENTAHVEVMRIKALDMDLIYTDNWLAVFSIVSGNEAKYFTITTDAKTNEGILTLNKEIDYEELKELDLKVSVTNKASYQLTSTESTSVKTYPIKIHVKNLPEGPVFKPTVKAVNISEGIETTLGTVIAKYPAVDGDTFEIVRNVRYMKIQDVANWLIIDENTAEIKLRQHPDRESKYLINGTYFAKIICITNDMPAKTSTGTIAVMVEDYNDHCPELLPTAHSVCMEKRFLYVSARDDDLPPNGAPFVFTVLGDGTKVVSSVERINDTTSLLRLSEDLWPGRYEVVLEVQDQQGKVCPQQQLVRFQLCTCTEGRGCAASRTSTSITTPFVGLLLLGFLLLLLVPLLLLFCVCGGAGAGGYGGAFAEIPIITKSQLMPSNLEGPGEDKVIPLLSIPTEVDGQVGHKKVNTVVGGGMFGAGVTGTTVGTGASAGLRTDFYSSSNMVGSHWMGDQHLWAAGHGGSLHTQYEGGALDAYHGMALSEEFLEEYYSQKASQMALLLESHRDVNLAFGYEGEGSVAGSLGSCSELSHADDLEFLDNLGPKFRILAELCTGSAIEVETTVAPPPRPVAKPRTQVITPQVTVETGQSVSGSSVAVDVGGLSSASSSLTSTAVGESVQMKGHASSSLSAKTISSPGTAYVIQPQPVYIAATPILHVVEPTMLLSEGSVQGMYLVSGTPAAKNLLVKKTSVVTNPTMSLGDNLVLLETRAVEDHGLQSRNATENLGGNVIQKSQKVVMVETQSGRGTGKGSVSADNALVGTVSERETQRNIMSRHGEGQGLGAELIWSHAQVGGAEHQVVMQEKVSFTERSVQRNVTG